MAAASLAAESSISELLVADAAWHVEAATKPGDASDVVTRDSLHPHPSRVNYSGSVTILGAKALWITFDPLTSLSSRTATLTFYERPGAPTPLRTYTAASGRGSEWRPLMVRGDTVHYTFICNSDSSFLVRGASPKPGMVQFGDISFFPAAFGYRFHVAPMRGLQWLSEQQVITDPSLEWACWLLDFLLKTDADVHDGGSIDTQQHQQHQQASAIAAAVHSPAIVSALLRYLRAPGAPVKHRVVALLIQLLKRPHAFQPGRGPDFDGLKRIESVVMSRCNADLARGAVFPPSHLQQLVEMCLVARAAERAIREHLAPRQAFKSDDISEGSFLFFKKVQLRDPIKRVPVVPAAALSLQEQLLDVYDMADCLLVNARWPDHLICAICEAVHRKVDDKRLIDVVKLNAAWSPAADEELLRWAGAVATSRSQSALTLHPAELDSVTCSPPRDDLTHPLLCAYGTAAVQYRFAALQLFNSRLSKVVELIDLAATDKPYMLASTLRALAHCILPDTKTRVVEAAIDATWAPGFSNMLLSLDNALAFQTLDAGISDPAISNCVFMQSFNQLGARSGRPFRCRLDDKGRLFYVRFLREEGLDWGGLYRDAIVRMVDDCFSDHLDLFTPCPNHNGTYLPNVKYSEASSHVLRLYEFVGRLLGVSMRQRQYLPFALPRLIWKLLCGQGVTLADLAAVDETTASYLQRMAAWPDGSSEAAFAAEFPGSRFLISRANGQVAPLLPGGASIRVTPQNRRQFVDLALKYKLHEFDRQVAALYAGLVSVVPERAVKLCTGGELEVLVCGDARIDVEVLKAHTSLHGYYRTDKNIRMFWSVLRSFTDDERSRFLRFVYGRTRLPNQRNWERPFKITRKPQSGDDQLPVAHSCFFHIELPVYSSEEIMARRIRAAIHFGLDAYLIA